MASVPRGYFVVLYTGGRFRGGALFVQFANYYPGCHVGWGNRELAEYPAGQAELNKLLLRQVCRGRPTSLTFRGAPGDLTGHYSVLVAMRHVGFWGWPSLSGKGSWRRDEKVSHTVHPNPCLTCGLCSGVWRWDTQGQLGGMLVRSTEQPAMFSSSIHIYLRLPTSTNTYLNFLHRSKSSYIHQHLSLLLSI